MSHPSAVDLAVADRGAFLVFWSALLMRRIGGVGAIARAFACTEQTARNWIDGAACPTGHAVMRAVAMFPADFGVRHGR